MTGQFQDIFSFTLDNNSFVIPDLLDISYLAPDILQVSISSPAIPMMLIIVRASHIIYYLDCWRYAGHLWTVPLQDDDVMILLPFAVMDAIHRILMRRKSINFLIESVEKLMNSLDSPTFYPITQIKIE